MWLFRFVLSFSGWSTCFVVICLLCTGYLFCPVLANVYSTQHAITWRIQASIHTRSNGQREHPVFWAMYCPLYPHFVHHNKIKCGCAKTIVSFFFYVNVYQLPLYSVQLYFQICSFQRCFFFLSFLYEGMCFGYANTVTIFQILPWGSFLAGGSLTFNDLIFLARGDLALEMELLRVTSALAVERLTSGDLH